MKELNEEGRETVDGHVVELYEMRFTGGIVLEPEEGASISSGDLITCMVTARVGPPKMANVAKTGEYKRINTSKLESLVVLDADVAKKFYDDIGEEVFGVNEGMVEISYVKPQVEQKEELGFDPSLVLVPGAKYG